MAPVSFKDMISVDYRPGEPEEIKYYAQKRRKQYHGNESKDIDELSMKSDKKLPNLKIPVKGKKGVSKFMRKKVITKAKDDLNASVQSADRKPEKYIKPDGKVGVRMVKTDKEVIKKEASVLKPTKPTDISKHARTLAKNDDDYNRNKKKYIDKARAKVFKMYPKESINHDDAHRDAQQHSNGSMSVKKIPSMIKKSGDKHLHLHMKSYHKEKDGQDFAKKHGYKVKNYVKTPSGTRMDIHKEAVELDEVSRAESNKVNAMLSKVLGNINFTHFYAQRGGIFKLPANVKHEIIIKKNDMKKATELLKKDTGQIGQMYKKGQIKLDLAMEKNVVESVDEALTLQQRMKRSRLMKRMKARIKIGRDRARRKMADKGKLERRAMRQARAQIAKKLTRGIPKGELSFARKQEIEKRLDKPALKQRIKRIAKRIFKDVRKKEVQRKKG